MIRQRIAPTVCASIITCIAALWATAADDLAAQIVEMTGARTKLVWQHQVTITPGNNWDATTAEYELAVYDTADGKQRVILPGPANYSNPCLTADGSRIVFADAPNGKAYVVDWDGRNKRLLINGYSLDTWADPKTGTDWVYADSGGKVIRFQLDNPEVREVVWDKTGVANRFRVSADGTRAGGEFSWPNAGVAILPNVSWKQYGNGCNSAIAPDNSYRLFHMGEAASHGGVMMYDTGGVNKRTLLFDNVPGKERQASWVPRWTNDVRFLTLSCPIGGPSQELYLGEFDENFTTVKRWIRITNQTGQDVYGNAWIDPGLGYHTGEVPLTVEIPAPGDGQWQWDHGDGTITNAGAVTHTYKKAGEYRITATRGGTIIKGSVRGYPAKPPSMSAIRLYDETNLSVMFDERVQMKNANVSLASGAAVASSKLDPDGLSLLVKLNAKLTKGDSLRVEGVYDKAQVPNALARRTFPIQPPAWPSDRSNLVFLWETNHKPSFQWQPSSESFDDTQLDSWKRRSFDRFGAMSFEGGVLFAIDGGLGAYNECTKANRFAIEAVITPANKYQGWSEQPRWIVACNSGGGIETVNVMIAQEGDKAVLYVKQRPADNQRAKATVKRVELCTMIDQAPNHVVASYEPGNLTCYLNGKPVMQNTEINGALIWQKPNFATGMSFGGNQVVTNNIPFRKEFDLPWRGKIEGIALYSRTVTAEEAAANFAAYDAILKARPAAPRVTVRGKLLAKSDVPTIKDIAPYRDAMVAHEYEVEEVVEGTYAQKKIRVARWGLVDARPSAVASEKPGESVALVVEPFADHPQLEAEVLSDTLDEDFDLPLYYEISNGPTDAPYLAAVRVRPREIWIPPGEKMQYRALVRDQYGNPIKAPVRWSVLPGGHINAGM
ncbi:MAG: PKD domain-containing protein, partial [Planctomycetes bacterium]|nr:PKD domain-containing protein [Planctomycetota bacterium]